MSIQYGSYRDRKARYATADHAFSATAISYGVCTVLYRPDIERLPSPGQALDWLDACCRFNIISLDHGLSLADEVEQTCSALLRLAAFAVKDGFGVCREGVE